MFNPAHEREHMHFKLEDILLCEGPTERGRLHVQAGSQGCLSVCLKSPVVKSEKS